MIAFVAAASPTAGVAGAAAVYLAVGAAVGAVLRRRGVEPATAWSALAVWPLLVPLLADAAPPAPARGPLAARIDDGVEAVARVAALPGAADPCWSADLARLRAALDAADRRLAWVDRLLADAPPDADAATRREVDALREARDGAAAEIVDVLASLERLRLQLGRLLLAGEGAAVGDTLRILHDRVAATAEIARVGSEGRSRPGG